MMPNNLACQWKMLLYVVVFLYAHPNDSVRIEDSLWLGDALRGMVVVRLAAVGESEFGLDGGVGGVTVMALLAFTMRLLRDRIAAVEKRGGMAVVFISYSKGLFR